MDDTSELRKLDILVAEKLMGAKVTHLNQKSGWCIDYVTDKDECNNPIMTDWGADGYRLKFYSKDIKSAWDIVEKLKERMCALEFDFTSDRYYANFITAGEIDPDHPMFKGKGATAAESICRAALRTVGVDNG